MAFLLDIVYRTPVLVYLQLGDSMSQVTQIGMTQWLVEKVIECLREGQPSSVVIGASTEHARYLQYRLCSSLDELGEPYTMTHAKSCICVGDQVIEFVSIQNIDRWLKSHMGYGEFWHDYADWCYERYLA